MHRWKAPVVAAAAALALAANAHAADMPRFPWPDAEKPRLTAAEFVSGWYLRGDFGYRWTRASVEPGPGFFDNGSASTVDKKQTFGGGFGYKHRFLRVDGTFDYAWRARTFTALLNGYIDFGTWGGLTPYVGAGIGSSRFTGTDFQDLAPVVGLATVSPREQWQMSWAWTAGISYQFMPNLALDVGYRYLKLGDSVAAYDRANVTVVTFRRPEAQEVRVGLRLLID